MIACVFYTKIKKLSCLFSFATGIILSLGINNTYYNDISKAIIKNFIIKKEYIFSYKNNLLRFVKELLSQNNKVTVISRNISNQIAHPNLNYIKEDKENLLSTIQELGQKWDVIYDQICFNASDAQNTLNALESKAKKSSLHPPFLFMIMFSK